MNSVHEKGESWIFQLLSLGQQQWRVVNRLRRLIKFAWWRIRHTLARETYKPYFLPVLR
ncbi:MAG: hypothetical protein IBX69_09060 [Anaerolineales bacterium]|nr:hypothetical protein [Anaerolineales bacterium]